MLPLMDGADVFRLMDSEGLPLDVIQDLLAEKGMGFNVVGFARAALASGNYGPQRTLELLEQCAPKSVPPGACKLAVARALGLV